MSDSDPKSGTQWLSSPDTDTEAESDPLRISLTVENRDTLLEMMSALNDREIPVQTEDISRRTLDKSQTATIDLEKLTDKQRRTLEIALDTGYYEQPRKTDLANLAEEIGISKSAVSQRLRAAESKLVKNTLGEYR